MAEKYLLRKVTNFSHLNLFLILQENPKKLTKKHRMNNSKLEKHKKKSEEEPDESIKLTDTNDVVSFSEGDFKKKTRPEVLQ